MRVQELLAQGVKRFKRNHRWIPNGQSAWLRAPVAGGKTTAAQLVRAALDQAWFLGIQDQFAPWRPEQELSRFALTIARGDELRHRIICDLRSGSVAAGRWQGEDATFIAAAPNAEAVTALLTDQYDFPRAADWAALYWWAGGSGSGAGEAAGAAAGVTDADEIRARLEELMVEKSLMSNVDQLQFELDGLESQRFATEEEIGRLDKRLAEVAGLRENLEKTRALDEADERLFGVAKDFDRWQRKYGDDRTKREDQLNEKRARLQAAAGGKYWHQDPVFLALSAGALAGFIVPSVLGIYALNLLGFAGLGGVGFWAWKTKQTLDSVASLEKEVAAGREELDQWVARQEADQQAVRELTRLVGGLDAKDLLKAWEQRKGQLEALEKAEAKLAEADVEAKRTELAETLTGLQQKIARLEATMEENVAGAGRDVNEIEREIKALEKQLAMVSAGGAALAAASTGDEGERPAPREAIAAAIPAALQIARKDPDTMLPQLGTLATRILQAVWPDRVHAVQFDPAGRVRWIDSTRREPLEEREVDRGLELVTAAAVLVGGARLAAQTRSFPLVWDEPFGDLDDVTLGRLAGVLAKAAGDLQLLVFSGRQALGSAFGTPIDLQ